MSITAGLAALPAGWSSPTGTAFSCASISVGSGCQLTLSYSPSLPDAGSFTLVYTYTNDSGVVKSGFITLSYTAT